MKTAIVDMYHVFGTRSGLGCRVLYRGKCLFSVTGNHSQSADFLKAAIKHAAALGFTHWRRLDGMGGRRNIIEPVKGQA